MHQFDFFFLVVLRFELQVSRLLASYHLSHSTSPFCDGWSRQGLTEVPRATFQTKILPPALYLLTS
jgi:hypothetical protein